MQPSQPSQPDSKDRSVYRGTDYPSGGEPAHVDVCSSSFDSSGKSTGCKHARALQKAESDRAVMRGAMDALWEKYIKESAERVDRTCKAEEYLQEIRLLENENGRLWTALRNANTDLRESKISAIKVRRDEEHRRFDLRYPGPRVSA
jgi:hypothetical protein